MKKTLSVILSIILSVTTIVVTIGSVSGIEAQAATFTDLNQSQITAAMGLGWNLGNQLEANSNGYPSETAWGNPTITAQTFTMIKNAGFSTVRIPVSWLGYIGSAPNYTVDSAWMARVKTVVDYAIDAGLYVVINVHGDGYSSVTGGWLLPGASNQSTINAKFSALWTQIANTFKDYDQHLIFESMNEIGADANYDWETVYNQYTNINSYNQTFVNAVRSTGGNNQKRWLIVPGWNTNIDYTASEWQNFVLPTDSWNSSPRVMVSVHYYSPWEFCGDESYTVTGWGSGSSNNAGWGDETYMQEQLTAMYSRFVTAGYPVFVGEFGCIDKGNSSNRVNFARTFCQYCKNYGCIPVWWDNGYNGTYGFGLFDRSSYSVTQSSIISAMTGVMGTGSSATTTTTTKTTTKATTTTTTTSSSSNTGTSGLDGYYYIKAKSSNLYLNIQNDSSDNNAALVQENGDGAMAQKFRLVSTGTAGEYYIYTGASNYNKVLDVSGNSSANGASLIQYSFSGNTNQKFKLVKSGNYYGILTGASSYASGFDVYGWSTTVGDPIKQYSYGGSDNQLFYLESCSSGSSSTTTTTTKATTTTKTTTTTKATTTTTTAASSGNNGVSGLDGYYYIKAKSSGLYLNTQNDSANNSALLVQENGDGAMAQKFRLVSTGTAGVYYIYTGASNYTKVLDVNGKKTADGTSIIQYTYSGSNNQQFKLVKVGNYYAILTGVTSYASGFDVYNWSTTAGDPINQYGYWGGDCQLFTLESCSSGSSSTTTTTTKAATTTKTTTTTTKASSSNTASTTWKFSDSGFSSLGTISSTKTVNGLTLNASSSKTMEVKSGSASVGGTSYSKYLALGGSGSNSYRSMSCSVSGTTTVSVVAKSSGSATRSLVVKDAGGNTLATLSCTSSAQKLSATINYTGTIYIYSTNSGINVWALSLN